MNQTFALLPGIPSTRNQPIKRRSNYPSPYISLPQKNERTNLKDEPAITIGRENILKALSSACGCLALVPTSPNTNASNENDKENKNSTRRKFRPSPSCDYCNGHHEWMGALSRNMIRVGVSEVSAPGVSASEPQWTVELVGRNRKIAFVNGQELKKNDSLFLSLGSEIIFQNPKNVLQQILLRVGDAVDDHDHDHDHSAKKSPPHVNTGIVIMKGGGGADDVTRSEAPSFQLPLVDLEHQQDQDAIQKQRGEISSSTSTATSTSTAHVLEKDQPFPDAESKENEPRADPQSIIIDVDRAAEQNGQDLMSSDGLSVENGDGRSDHDDDDEKITDAHRAEVNDERDDEKEISSTKDIEKPQIDDKGPQPQVDSNDGIGELPTSPVEEDCDATDEDVEILTLIPKKSMPQCSSPDARAKTRPDSCTEIELDGPATPRKQMIENECKEVVIDLVSPTAASASSLAEAMVVDLVSDESQEQDDCIAKKPQSDLPLPLSNPQPSVFLLPWGRDMSSSRIKILSESLKKNTDLIVQTQFNAKKLPCYIVVNKNLEVDALRTHLGFSNNDEMSKCLKGVHIVKPNWVINRISSDSTLTEQEPTMDQCWGKLHALRERKKRNFAELESSPLINPWLKKIRKMHEFAPEVRVHASRTDNEMINHLYQLKNGRGSSDGAGAEGRISTHFEGRNLELSQLFDTISKLYKEMPIDAHDSWRSYCYNICAGRLRYLDFEVEYNKECLDKLSKMKGFGEKIMKQTKEFLATGSCKLIKEFEHDALRLGIRNMTRIWGVGPVMAAQLVNSGYKNIRQIRDALEYNELPAKLLSRNAKVGVEFYEEFREKMDRHEVRTITKIVEDAVRKYFPEAEVTAMGSYRRGKLQCGDVDVLITHEAYPKATPLGALCELVERLKAQGHISHHLTKVEPDYFKNMPSQDLDFHPSTFHPYPNSQSYMGVFNSPLVRGKHRRIDIKFYPYRERISSKVYFTGNGYFNRSMRLFVKRRKGMKLDDHGLFTHEIGSPYTGKRIKLKSEKELFDFLGLIWREPHERDGFDAVRLKENNEIFRLEDGGLEVMNKEEMNSELRHQWVD